MWINRELINLLYVTLQHGEIATGNQELLGNFEDFLILYCFGGYHENTLTKN